jgi:hypothetical protein
MAQWCGFGQNSVLSFDDPKYHNPNLDWDCDDPKFGGSKRKAPSVLGEAF